MNVELSKKDKDTNKQKRKEKMNQRTTRSIRGV
jgi:hypothetical protein